MKINKNSNHDEEQVESSQIYILLHNYKKMKLWMIKEDTLERENRIYKARVLQTKSNRQDQSFSASIFFMK